MTESTAKRRWKWIVLPILAIGLLPTLLTVTGKHDAVLRWVQPELADVMSYESLSTHWWQPIELNQVRINEESGRDKDSIPVLSAVRIRSRQPLWKLALSKQPIEFDLEQPVLNLISRDGTNNLQTLLRRFENNDEKSDSGRSLSVVIQNGLVRLVSSPGGELQPLVREVRNINGHVKTHAASLLPEVILTADVDESRDARTVRLSSDQKLAANLADTTADFPLQPFEQQTFEKSDDASPTFSFRITPAEQNTQQIFLETHKLNFATIRPVMEWLVPDVQLKGQVSCRAQAQVMSPESADESLGLAARLQILAEEVDYRQTGWAFGESLKTDSLIGSAAFALAEDGVLVKDLEFSSAFFNVNGSGAVQYRKPDPVTALSLHDEPEAHRSAVAEAAAASSGTVRLSGEVDLAAVLSQLKTTVKLSEGVVLDSGKVQFSGRIQQQATAVSALDPRPQSGFGWTFAAVTSPLSATQSGKRIEVPTEVRLDAAGSINGALATLDQVELQSSFGQMQLDPIEDGYRIQAVIRPQQAWQDLSSILTLSRPSISSDVRINGDIRNVDSRFLVSNASVVSQGLRAEANRFLFDGSKPLLDAFEGSLEVRGEAAALKALILPFHDAWWLAERCDVVCRMVATPGQELLVQAAVQDPSQRISQQFAIDSGKLELRLIPDSSSKAWLVQNSYVELPGLQADLSGSLSQREGMIHANLQAVTDCDLQIVTDRFLKIGDSVSLSGRPRVQIHLEGSPGLLTVQDLRRHQAITSGAAVPAESLQVSAVIPWDNGRLLQMPLGPGQLDLNLKDGMLTSEPIQCALGTGELAVMPRYDLQSNVVQLAAGSRVQNFQLTPELTSQWLTSIAPLLGDSASVNGTASVRVQRFEYPFDRQTAATAVGTLSLSETTASPGASLGPLLQVLTAIGRQDFSGRNLVLPRQDVAFQMQNGWIQHDRLQMDLNDYLLQSSGAVSTQGQVQLSLEVPLQKSRAGQRGRAVTVPVRGTTKRPQLDVAGLWQNIGRQQVQERLNDEVQDGLGRLLNKIRD